MKPPSTTATERWLIQHIEKLENDMHYHLEWHRKERQRQQEAVCQYHESMGMSYAIARNRADACRGAFVHGPTHDLTELRNVPAENGNVIVLFNAFGNSLDPAKAIVEEHVDGRWQEVDPPLPIGGKP